MGTISVGKFRGPIAVQAGLLSDTFDVTGPRAGGRIYDLDGGLGTDKLIGPDTTNVWEVRVQNQGALTGAATFAHVESLSGNGGEDVFRFFDGAGLGGRVDGGGGLDTLDFSRFFTPVVVNLASGQANRVAGGVSRIQNVFGGFAGDTLTGDGQDNALFGNAGRDVINGGSGGRDLLVGGLGADTLTTGGTGDTIYVGADLNPADQNNTFSVRRILTDWTSAKSYETRVADLLTGAAATGGVELSPDTLENDLAADAFNARAGRDVFFVEPIDTFAAGSLPAANESVITV
jgi:Ca2+-binding RTX toxin-like protein